LVEFARKITKSELFNRAILGLIILSGVLVGLETYPQFSDETALGRTLSFVQNIILICFVIEIFLKIVACGNKPWTYFSEGWNVFDFLIVLICVLQPYSQSASVVRLARILRALRTITVLPRLRLLVSALLRSIPSLGYIGILLGLHFYIYSVIGTVAFGKNDPIRFGSLHETATTLFQVLTLEGWNDVRDTQVMGSDVTYDEQWKELAGSNRKSYADPLGATIFFTSFILLGTMIMLNLFTGVIISSMEEAQGETTTGTRADQLQQRGYLTLHDELALLNEQLQSMSEQINRLRNKPPQE
jgi:voltage-gated sodium channel